MKITPLLYLALALMIYSCTDKPNSLPPIVEDYYSVYNERQDFKAFLSFYDEQIILEDIINGDRMKGKAALTDFFNWSNPHFKRLGPDYLIAEHTVIQKNVAVIKGHFSRFQWQESEFEPMHFTTILTFNEFNKIVKQVDWINYPPALMNSDDRKNANEWLE